MKRILSFLVAAVLMINCAIPAVFAADTTVVSVSSAEAAAGDTVTLTVSISEATFASYLMTLEYDKTALELQTITEGDVKTMVFMPNTATGIVSTMGISNLTTSGGSLFTATFKVLTDVSGEYPVTVTVSNVVDSNAQRLNVSVDAGAVIVPSSGCTHQWGEWEVTKEATASAEGEQTRTCGLCGTAETQVIPVLAPSATVTVSTETVVSGDTVALTVSISEATFASYLMTLQYDKAALELVSIDQGEVEAGFFVPNTTTGTVTDTGFTDGVYSGTLFTATFKVLTEELGEHPVSVQVNNVVNAKAEHLDVTVVPGAVVVIPGEVEPDATVTVSTETVVSGDTVALTVSISEATFASYLMTLQYDKAALELVSIDQGEVEAGFFVPNTATGTVTDTGFTDGVYSGTLFTATFKVLTEELGEHPVSVQVNNVVNAKAEHLDVTVVPGAVVVIPGTFEPDATVTVSTETVVVGDTVSLTVSISEATFASYLMTLQYDKAALELVSIDQGEVEAGFFVPNIFTGTVTDTGFTDGVYSGTLFTATFKLLTEELGEYPVSVQVNNVVNAKAEYLNIEVIPGIVIVEDRPHEHTWGDWITTVEPTCTETGVETRTCTSCDAQETQELPSRGHDLEAVVTAPTCTEQGYTTYTCTRCDYSSVGDYTDMIDHTSVADPAVQPTCTETGLTEGSHCSVCGQILKAQEIVEALGHDEVVVPAVDPTCTATGLTEGKNCARCGETLVAQEVVEALGHDEVVVPAVDPTCTATGLTEGKNCARCGETLVAQEVVEALGHGETIIPAVQPTCTETGLTEGKNCSRCGEVLVVQEVVEALGHDDAIIPAVAPTCTATGLTEGIGCSRCDVIKTPQEVVPMIEHTWDDGLVTTRPTASTEGEMTYTCTVCGQQKKVSIPAGCDHAYAPTVTDPTCINAGFTTYTCIHCGDDYIDKYVDALGHKYQDGLCTVCKAKDPNYCDVDGVDGITNVDAMLVLQMFANITINIQIDLYAADVNSDGIVNNVDAMLLLQFYAGLITYFPAP